jgi:D-alanine--poly(phosphoribitol) ligase subunit 1
MEIIERIDRWASKAPSHWAHVSGSQRMCYLELTRFSNILAGYLSKSLPDDKSPIVICGHKENEMLVGFLGSIKSGHPYVPVDSSYPLERIESIMKSSQARLMLSPKTISEVLRNKPNVEIEHKHRKIQPDDPWYIIFTSGSTGEPKGVVITAGCLESFLSWRLRENIFKELGETFLNQAPFSFDLSVMDLYLSLSTGGTLFSITQEMVKNPKLLYQSLAVSGASIWVSTPSFAQMCLVEKTFNGSMLPNLRLFLFCGETLAPETASGLLDRFPLAEVWNTYGPTEATVATTSIRIDRDILTRFSPLPVGYPKPGSDIVVLKENEQPAQEEERGEIVIAGSHVSPGYIGRPDLNERVFFDYKGQHAYHTGDLGRFMDGLLFFDGRVDSQIKLHGYRIELGDVENNLRAIPDIRDAVVIPAIKDGKPDWLAAFVILEQPSSLSDFELTRILKRDLGQKVPPYMVPRKFYFLESFPLTINGKSDRRKLAERLA